MTAALAPGAGRLVCRRLYGLLLFAIGATLLIGGVRLIWLGGSLYYGITGLLILASGTLLWKGDRRARRAYWTMWLISVAWSIWEAGFDGWSLAGRLIALAVLGLPLPWLLAHASRDTPGEPRVRGRTALIALIGAVLIGAIAHAIGPAGDADPMYRTGVARWSGPSIRASTTSDGDWRNYANDLAGSRFSPLDQINVRNVSKLDKIWEVHLSQSGAPQDPSLETTPIKVGNTLYVCTAFNDVIAIDAESGHVNWRFNAGINRQGREIAYCRGVAFFEVPQQTGLCAQRIITNTVDARLIALDAATGERCPGFGTNGQVDLTAGLGSPDIGYYFVSSAPTIVRGKVVLGGWVSDGQHWGEPSGVIRAYDAASGKFAWAFDVGHPDDHGEPGLGETYTHSTPNSWAPMSADPELGLIYAPTGNPAVDYYGAQRRPFDEKYGSSVVALDIDTGAVRWSFQTTHHDLWDYDVGSQPTLFDIPTDHGVQHALVQPTKRGELFVLDRATGQPLTTVQERPVPQGRIPSERYAPTQPFSVGMPSVAGARYRERDMWGLTPLDQLWCRIKFKEARYEGTLTPPGLTPWIADPGVVGGTDWGSASIDPERGLLIVNASRIIFYNVLLPRADADALGVRPSVHGGPRIYQGIFPQADTPYAAKVVAFMSPLDVPCNKPPFGIIAAIDLQTHRLVWSEPLGEARDSGPMGVPSMLPFALGTPNAGGSLVTRAGLVFIAATQDRSFRALDVTSGKRLWSVRLPAGGQATPMSYWSDHSHRQFVVIAAGGRKGMATRQSDSLIAYALPQ